MKEYIVPVEDDEMDYEEYLVGYIRSANVNLIRCKNCRFFDSGICHAEDERVYDLSENHYCGFAESKEDQKA